ncbi:MAG: type II toxin-antitoxin system RelE/ParE family toxin [Chlorobium sp.]
MNTFVQTPDFSAWLSNLKDRTAKYRILARLKNAMFGNFGNCAPVGEGVSEMKIDVGQGYRVYYTRIGDTTYILLAGGDKSTQSKDIIRAKRLSQELKENKE